MSTTFKGRLSKLGIATVGDLLNYLPFRHEDYSRTVPIVFLQEGQKQTVRARVEKVVLRTSQRMSKPIVEAYLSDDTGRVKAMWFNQPYKAGQLHEGEEYVLSGMVRRQRRGAGLVMSNPASEEGERAGLHTGRLVPIYHETKGVSSTWLRRRVDDALQAADLMVDHVPDEVVARQRLSDFA